MYELGYQDALNGKPARCPLSEGHSIEPQLIREIADRYYRGWLDGNAIVNGQYRCYTSLG